MEMVQKDHTPEEEEVFQKGDKVFKKGDKYYCTECHSEIPVRQACHACKKEIDWDRVLWETRR
jgi:hypothetical protein